MSDTYAGVAPELANLLRNSVKTGNTFVEKEAKVRALFVDVAGFSRTSKDFLEQNGQNMIRLSRQGQAQLPLFAKYAPEYPCLIEGLVNQTPRLTQMYRNYTLHINLEPLKNSPTGYTTADTPRYGAHNGPHCERLPDPGYSQANRTPQPPIHAVDDGVSGGHGKFRPRSATGFDADLRVRRHHHRARAGEHLRRPRDGSPRTMQSPTSPPSWSGRWPAARR